MTDGLDVLYEDNHLLAVVKPAGLLVQGDRTGDVTLLVLAREYLRARYDKPGNIYLGLVHRLDRPVSGVMVLARTSKAAARLSKAFHDRLVAKTYLAAVSGSMEPDDGELAGFVERAHTRSRLAPAATERAREAVLGFRVLARVGSIAGLEGPRAGRARERKAAARRARVPAAASLLEVLPRTGRHHQIRLQLSDAGHPILGDVKYGAAAPLPDRRIALHAVRLRFPHPVRDEEVEVTAPPPPVMPWTAFEAALSAYVRAAPLSRVE